MQCQQVARKRKRKLKKSLGAPSTTNMAPLLIKAMKSKKPKAEIFHKTCKRLKVMKSKQKTHLICQLIVASSSFLASSMGKNTMLVGVRSFGPFDPSNTNSQILGVGRKRKTNLVGFEQKNQWFRCGFGHPLGSMGVAFFLSLFFFKIKNLIRWPRVNL